MVMLLVPLAMVAEGGRTRCEEEMANGFDIILGGQTGSIVLLSER